MQNFFENNKGHTWWENVKIAIWVADFSAKRSTVTVFFISILTRTDTISTEFAFSWYPLQKEIELFCDTPYLHFQKFLKKKVKLLKFPGILKRTDQ